MALAPILEKHRCRLKQIDTRMRLAHIYSKMKKQIQYLYQHLKTTLVDLHPRVVGQMVLHRRQEDRISSRDFRKRLNH